MECITYQCPNCTDDSNPKPGRAICVEPDDDGWICEPCWQFLTKATGRLNQVYQNGKSVAAERRRDQDSYYGGQARAMTVPASCPAEGYQRDLTQRGSAQLNEVQQGAIESILRRGGFLMDGTSAETETARSRLKA